MSRVRVNDKQWWADHGVSQEVRDARPYQRWTKDRKLDAIEAAYEGLSPSQRKTVRKWGRASSGLVIYRHPWDGDVERSHPRYVYAEIRPDEKVKVDPSDEEGRKYLFPPGLSRWVHWFHEGPPYNSLDAADAALTILERGGDFIPTDEILRQLQAGPRRMETHDEHYVPSSRYANAREAEEMKRKHVRSFHRKRRQRDKTPYYVDHVEPGGYLDGYHWHWSSVRIKEDVMAKRLDVNPLLQERLLTSDPEWWLFGLEGCIKSDSMLTAILAAGLPAGVFSVPSVGQWEATYPVVLAPDRRNGDELEEEETFDLGHLRPGDELAEFAARYLQGRPTFVVCDADAFFKEDVMSQALLCRTFLRRLGVDAHIAAPPLWSEMPGARRLPAAKLRKLEEAKGRPLEEWERWEKQGADDFLGRWKGDLLDLYVYDLEPRLEEEIREWLLAHRKWSDSRRLTRAVAVMHALSAAAFLPKTEPGHEGIYAGSVEMLARAAGLSYKRTLAALNDDLLPAGAIGPPGLDLKELRELRLTAARSVSSRRLNRRDADGRKAAGITVDPELTPSVSSPLPRLRDALGDRLGLASP